MDLYVGLKYIHVLLAIVAVGFNLSYGIWMSLARDDAGRIAFALAGIKTLDRVANGSYGLLLVTGLALAWIGAIPYETFWIAAALALYVLAVLIGIVVFAPLSRRQAALLAERGPRDPSYRAVAGRTTQLGILTTVIVLAIVFLMVTKPTP